MKTMENQNNETLPRHRWLWLWWICIYPLWIYYSAEAEMCNTDIELGVRCGFQTLLVLSGVTSSKDLGQIRSEQKPPLPDVVLNALGDLLSLIPS